MEFVYLVIFILWIAGIIYFKKNSNYALIPAFCLFMISAFFTVLNFGDTSEVIMRVSFIGWIIGVVISLIEYKKLKV